MSELTLSSAYRQVKARFEAAGTDSPALAARRLVKAVTGADDAALIADPDKLLTTEQGALLETYAVRHESGEPVSRILGQTEFWGLPFRVTPDVLDPRPDTETLVEAALNRFKDDPPETILDLGTGSGCILIALLHEWPQTRGVAVDISESALNTARQNAEINHVADRITFIRSDWGESVSDSFDLLVSNPPYISHKEVESLSPAVKNHDPIQALTDGGTGLNAYATIFSQFSRLVKPGGRGFFEVGYSQAEDVMRLAEKSGANLSRVYPDLAGIPRVVEISCGDK